MADINEDAKVTLRLDTSEAEGQVDAIENRGGEAENKVEQTRERIKGEKKEREEKIKDKVSSAGSSAAKVLLIAETISVIVPVIAAAFIEMIPNLEVKTPFGTFKVDFRGTVGEVSNTITDALTATVSTAKAMAPSVAISAQRARAITLITEEAPDAGQAADDYVDTLQITRQTDALKRNLDIDLNTKVARTIAAAFRDNIQNSIGGLTE